MTPGTTLATQARIAEAVIAKPANRFRWFELVYLLWTKAKKFDFARATDYELQQVLWAIQEDAPLPNLDMMQRELCNCRDAHIGKWSDGHYESCRWHKFRKAIQ